MITNQELSKALRNLGGTTPDPLACLGCAHEHNCKRVGCALLREAAKRLEKLARYEKAEQEGRLVELPSGVPSRVYAITSPMNLGFDEESFVEKEQIYCCQLESVTIHGDGHKQFRLYYNGQFVAWYVQESDFGKAVFLTREEAEAALKERENGG